MVLAVNMGILSEILSSKVRAEVFRLLFGLNDDALHMRDIERKSGFAIGTIQTEMKKLNRLDLVLKRRDGNRLYYSANRQHPIFPEIKALVIKTVGLLDVLRVALVDEKGIRVAFVFGSLADSAEKAGSDIDLMVVGNLGLRSLTRLLQGIAEKLGREINPYVLTLKEFKRRKNENEHFLTRVLKDSKLFIIGDENDLKTVGR
jgi:predicted nucleotidyltransferase